MMKVWQIHANYTYSANEVNRGIEPKYGTRWEKCFITKPIVMKVPGMGRVRASYKEQIIPRSPWATLSISRDKIAIKRAYARALARPLDLLPLLRLVNNRE